MNRAKRFFMPKNPGKIWLLGRTIWVLDQKMTLGQALAGAAQAALVLAGALELAAVVYLAVGR